MSAYQDQRSGINLTFDSEMFSQLWHLFFYLIVKKRKRSTNVNLSAYMWNFDRSLHQYIVTLDMKGCICHFTKWQIHPFISKGTNYMTCVICGPFDMKGCFCHYVKWQIHPFISNGAICYTGVLHTIRTQLFTLKNLIQCKNMYISAHVLKNMIFRIGIIYFYWCNHMYINWYLLNILLFFK